MTDPFFLEQKKVSRSASTPPHLEHRVEQSQEQGQQKEGRCAYELIPLARASRSAERTRCQVQLPPADLCPQAELKVSKELQQTGSLFSLQYHSVERKAWEILR